MKCRRLTSDFATSMRLNWYQVVAPAFTNIMSAPHDDWGTLPREILLKCFEEDEGAVDDTISVPNRNASVHIDIQDDLQLFSVRLLTHTPSLPHLLCYC